MMIGLGLDDHAADALHQQSRADQVPRDDGRMASEEGRGQDASASKLTASKSPDPVISPSARPGAWVSTWAA